MSAFHRMVTYLHLYEHNVKGRNIGFAKIEKRGSQCLIEIHMKNTGHSISPVPVYFYTQKQQSLPGILLGNMSLVRGNGDFKTALEESSLSGSGYALEDVKGIFIPISEETMFVSQWDNDPFERNAFFPLETASPSDTTSTPADTSSIQENTIPAEKTSTDETSTLQTSGSNEPSTLQSSSPNGLPSQKSNGFTESSTPQSSSPNGLPSQKSNSPKGLPTPQSSSSNGLPTPQNNCSNGLPSQKSNGSDTKEPPKTPSSQEKSSESAPMREHASTKPDTFSESQKQAAECPASPPQTDSPSTQDVPHNSIKAAEAIPKHSHTTYRNPFALPRFMTLEKPNFTQGQRKTNRSFQNAPSKGHRKQMPMETQPASSAKAAASAGAESQNTKQDSSPPEDWTLKWQFLLEHYPVMTPFAGDENTLCIRLELKDLRLLPQKYWYLGNNSFLLHGFFNYRYLILGMTEKSEQKKWFIGIPGIFQNPERVMAALFGFPGFRNEKSVPINTGEFGYWYRFLDE